MDILIFPFYLQGVHIFKIGHFYSILVYLKAFKYLFQLPLLKVYLLKFIYASRPEKITRMCIKTYLSTVLHSKNECFWQQRMFKTYEKDIDATAKEESLDICIFRNKIVFCSLSPENLTEHWCCRSGALAADYEKKKAAMQKAEEDTTFNYHKKKVKYFNWQAVALGVHQLDFIEIYKT